MNSVLTKKQVKKFERIHNGKLHIANVRYDDECNNGHNTFAITGEVYAGSVKTREPDCGGCVHEEIAEAFPELAHLIKWHLCSSDGPMGYLGNTLYFAGDRDCWGLRKGEKRPIRNSKGETFLEWRTRDGLPSYKIPNPTQEGEILELIAEIQMKVGEGKERELEAARRAAIWPDATDEQLTASNLEDLLKARLPELIEEFRRVIESPPLNFVF